MSDNGFDAAPDRYTQQGRETIDRQRDLAFEWARSSAEGLTLSLPDLLFAYFCEAQALRYEDRAGAKGDPEGDAEKARWYKEMAIHVLGSGPDPRANRPGFQPYFADPKRDRSAPPVAEAPLYRSAPPVAEYRHVSLSSCSASVEVVVLTLDGKVKVLRLDWDALADLALTQGQTVDPHALVEEPRRATEK